MATADAAQDLTASQAEGRRVVWGLGEVRLKDPHLFGPRAANACRAFLRRVFRLEQVRSVEVETTSGSALIRYAPNGSDPAVFLARLADTIREDDLGVALDLGALPGLERRGTRLKVVRHGQLLSTWSVVHELPGRIRFRNEALRCDAVLAHRVEREVAGLQGVMQLELSPLTASVLVEFDPATTSRGQLLRVLEAALAGAGAHLANDPIPPPVRFGLVNASVALAVAGELAVPALQPISAALLIYANAGNLRAAWRQIVERRAGLPVLYTAIVAGTLLTGGFVAAAVMGWMIKFWQKQYRRRLFDARRDLLPELTQSRRFAWLEAGNAVVEVPVERLAPGDRVIVHRGETVPIDGRVVAGAAWVDERLIRGLEGPTRKTSGDIALANSRVVDGDLVLEVPEQTFPSRAAVLGQAVLAAALRDPDPHALTAHGAQFAARAVVPTLTAAGLGLLIGGPVTAAAILRPDYATGPGLGIALDLLEDVAACLRAGVLVRDGSALRRFAEVDAIVFDALPELERSGLVVASVVAEPGEREDEVLTLAYLALAGRDDERALALRTAMDARGLPTLDLVTSSNGADAGFWTPGRQSFEMHEVGGRPSAGEMVEIVAEGRPLGRITFVPSAEPVAASLFRELRRHGGPTIGLIGQDSRVAKGDFLLPQLSPETIAPFLAECRRGGMKVAFIGNGLVARDAIREAHVGISTSGEIDAERDPAPLLLLRPDLRGVGVAWERACAHVESVRLVQGATLVPNLASVAGAFAFGFTSLTSVVLTNIGTWSVYSKTHRRRTLRGRAGGSRRPSARRIILN